MSAEPNETQPSPSFAEYAAHGWKLCGIDVGKKAPTYIGWNEKPIIEDAVGGLDGAGILHVLSGTAALDLDDLESARPWLLERGVDVDALLNDPAAVQITSGRNHRAKLLYRMKRPLRTVKPKDSGLELRCATADGKSVQDVLPPSIHPITKRPYEWKYNEPLLAHWSNPPPMPAKLLALWRDLLAELPDDPMVPSHTDVPVDTVRKAISQYIQTHRKDVSDYTDWLDVGMRLHHQFGGNEIGLDIWDEWSRSDISTRSDGSPRYQGRATLKAKWKSFSSEPGKRTVGMESLISRLPATSDEFEVKGGDSRPVITLGGGELHNIAMKCEEILSPDIFVRERQLVRIGGVHELPDEHGGTVRRDETQAVVISVTAEYIRRQLSQRVRFHSFRRREKEYVQVDCPKDIALNIAGQGDWPKLRPLAAISRAPFVRSDGSICETPGYDAASRVFYQPNAKFPSVPEKPTREDADRALSVLLKPFREFPFASDAARSAFVAHVLTEIVRPAIETSPAFLYTAPKAGTGKTLLSEMPSRIAHGNAPAQHHGSRVGMNFARFCLQVFSLAIAPSDSTICQTATRCVRQLSVGS